MGSATPVAMNTTVRVHARPSHISVTVVVPGATLSVCVLTGLGHPTSLEAGLEAMEDAPDTTIFPLLTRLSATTLAVLAKTQTVVPMVSRTARSSWKITLSGWS